MRAAVADVYDRAVEGIIHTRGNECCCHTASFVGLFRLRTDLFICVKNRVLKCNFGRITIPHRILQGGYGDGACDFTCLQPSVSESFPATVASALCIPNTDAALQPKCEGEGHLPLWWGHSHRLSNTTPTDTSLEYKCQSFICLNCPDSS